MTNRYRYSDVAGEHVHLLDGRPLIGTSRVGSILAKPLTWWASGLAVQTFGCPDPKVLTKLKNKKATVEERFNHEDAMRSALSVIKQMDEWQFGQLIDKAYRAHDVYMRSRAKPGKDLHSECEKFVKEFTSYGIAIFGAEAVYEPQIRPFIQWTEKNVKRFLWSEGHCYSEKMMVGGISDCGAELNNGKFAIIDFKSTREGYVSQFIQLAGYDLQISENGIVDANGNPIYSLEKPVQEYYIWAFGGEKAEPYPYYDMKGAREAFRSALQLYKFLPRDNG